MHTTLSYVGFIGLEIIIDNVKRIVNFRCSWHFTMKKENEMIMEMFDKLCTHMKDIV